MSFRTPSSPTQRSTHCPSTVISPSSSRPSSTKNAVAAFRSLTTMPTLSIRWSIVVLLLGRAAHRGPWYPWDGASATFSRRGSSRGIGPEGQRPRAAAAVLSLRGCGGPSVYRLVRYDHILGDSLD